MVVYIDDALKNCETRCGCRVSMVIISIISPSILVPVLFLWFTRLHCIACRDVMV